jgi:hypothetical protein
VKNKYTQKSYFSFLQISRNRDDDDSVFSQLPGDFGADSLAGSTHDRHFDEKCSNAGWTQQQHFIALPFAQCVKTYLSF